MLTVRALKKNLLLVLFFIITLSFYAFFQQGSKTTMNSTSDIIINDDIYSQDSIQLLKYWDLYWKYDNSDLHDSAIYVCNKMIDLGKVLIPFRYDSVLFERYAKAYGGIGYHLMKQGNYDKGLEYSFQSYDVLKSMFGENHIRITEVLVGISNNYLKRGDYDLALKYIFKSLEIMYKTLPRDHHYFGNNYSNLGHVYEKAEEYNKAIQWKKIAINHQKKAYRPGSKNGVVVPYTMQGLAIVYLNSGDEKSAESIITESINLNNHVKGDLVYNTLAHFWLGKTYFQSGDFKAAKDNYILFLDSINLHSETREDSPIEGDGFFGLGEIEEKQKNYKNALALYDKAINSWIKHYGSGGRDKIITCFHRKGNLYVELGLPKEALENYHTALGYLAPTIDFDNYYSNPSLDELSPNVLLLETLRLKINCLAKIQEKDPAIENSNKILESAELYINLAIKLQASYQWDNSKYSLLEKIKPISELYLKTASTIYQISGEKDYLNKMFSIVQKSKSAVLQERLKETQAKDFANVAPENRAKEIELKAKLAEYEKKIFDQSKIITTNNIEDLVNLNTKALDIKLAMDSLNNNLLDEYPEYLNSKSQHSFATVSGLKKHLDSNTGIIEYFLGDSSLYVFAITQSNIHFKSLPIDNNFIKSIINFRSLFQSYNPGIKRSSEIEKDFHFFGQKGKYLYDRLLAEMLPKISSNNIIIIPDGVLNYLPYHLLLTQIPDKETIDNFSYRQLSYLFLEKNIRYEYSASFIGSKTKSNKFKNNYAGFAPEYEGDLLVSRGYSNNLAFKQLSNSDERLVVGKLLYNKSEIINGAEITGGEAYSDRQASESIFKKEANNNNIIHLAGHYLVNDEAPIYSMFLFGGKEKDKEDGKLYIYELYNMQLNSNLAILSGCDTGNGKLQKGEGILSLSRAFKYAGCPNIVMSQWRADDQSCKQIMTSFLGHLKKGLKKNDALKEACKEYLNDALDDKSHPYYWGNFMLIGDNDPINMGGQNSWKWLIGGLIILTFLLWSRRLVK